MEPFLVVFDGGPLDGYQSVLPNATWPLPIGLAVLGVESDVNVISSCSHGQVEEDHPHSCYRKVSESQLGPQPEGSHLVRGAEYRWRELVS